ncbi:hypothetical protein [Pelagicoccus mobilis]|uniref:Methyl-accepting transducer domain-containing protein n=1 Tax=Pelagicoccus mobilis TaxID=415221 RepID=A0A934RXV3_9BACT|nr:hypothetical protein [Pelagicoccus mobilis]MBK1877470.1 hypothetical protein [Pelagicoccus mobilis]
MFREQVLLSDSLLEQGTRISNFGKSSEGNKSVFQQAIELINSTLEFVQDSSEKTAGLLEAFEQYQQKTATVKRGENQLSQTLIPLQIIERLFRIESSTLPVEIQSAFDSLTEEISNLHNQMRLSLSEQFEELARTERQTIETKSFLEQHSKSLSENISAAAQNTQQTILNLEKLIEEGTHRASLLEQSAKELSYETNQVMVGLQFQDVLRQKTDHVNEAISRLSSIIESPTTTKREKISQVYCICEIEDLQVNAIEEDLKEASRTISSSISTILERLHNIDTINLSDAALKNLTRSNREIVDTLLETLELAFELVDQAVNGIAVIHKAISKFEGAASDVSTTLRGIAIDIRLIALNAQIQAAQAGTGTGLEVLSEETCKLSESSEKYTQSIGDELSELIALFSEIEKQCGTIQQRTEEHFSSTRSDRETLKGKLLQSHNETSDALNEMVNVLELSRKNAVEMRSHGQVSDVPKTSIHELSETLTLAREFAKKKTTPSEIERARNSQEIRALQSQYTMASERSIHTSVLSGSGFESENAATEADFEEVELF